MFSSLPVSFAEESQKALVALFEYPAVYCYDD
jgi:hypothetical protein